MRSAKLFLILSIILITGAVAKADEIFVSANANFEKPGDGDGQFTFSTSFLYNLETSSSCRHLHDTDREHGDVLDLPIDYVCYFTLYACN